MTDDFSDKPHIVFGTGLIGYYLTIYGLRRAALLKVIVMKTVF
jgi:hypothetical protein